MKNILKMLFAEKECPKAKFYHITTMKGYTYKTYAHLIRIEYLNNGKRNVEFFLEGRLVSSICDFESVIEIEYE